MMVDQFSRALEPIYATRVVELRAGRAEAIERARSALRRMPRESDPSVDGETGIVEGTVHWRHASETVTIWVTELDPGRSRLEIDVGSETRWGRRDEDVEACLAKVAEYLTTPVQPLEQPPASDNRQLAAIGVALVAGWVVAIPLAVAFGTVIAADSILASWLVFEAPFLITIAVSGRHFELHGMRQWVVVIGLTLIAAPIGHAYVMRIVSGLTGGG